MDDKQIDTKTEILAAALRACHEHFMLHKESFRLSMTETTLKLDTFDMSIVIKHRKETPCRCR